MTVINCESSGYTNGEIIGRMKLDFYMDFKVPRTFYWIFNF